MELHAGVIGSMVDRRTVMIMPYYIHEGEQQRTFMEFHKRLEKTATEVGGRRVGLGLYFSSSLCNIHDKGAIAIMQGIKKSIDPNNIMNPGKTISDHDLLAGSGIPND